MILPRRARKPSTRSRWTRRRGKPDNCSHGSTENTTAKIASCAAFASTRAKITTVVATIENEGFHEIQLNGKQLVFLFMAATVVSVVIFLWGVLVGRGVRAERGGVTDAAPTSVVSETLPQQPAAAPAPTPA